MLDGVSVMGPSFVFLQVGDLSNPELRLLTDQLSKITFSGELWSYDIEKM